MLSPENNNDDNL